MQLKSMVVSAFVATAAAKQRCAAPDPTAEQLEISRQMAIQEANHLTATGEQFSAQATIETNVYFHVVASGTTEAAGYLSVSIPFCLNHLKHGYLGFMYSILT